VSDRTLDLVPIVHSEADLGRLADTARAASGDREAWARKQRAVEELWRSIERWTESLHVVPGRLHVYQDGLPVCGQEERIVGDLARQGSRNHRILERLVRRGATLHGTEQPELLLEEYEQVRRGLEAAESADDARRRPAANGGADAAAGHDLLRRRDVFIARRIDETLPAGGSGILFIGLLHDVEGHLPADVVVRHPVGRPAPAEGAEPADPRSAEESRR
jgi:hypothetical protein